MMVSTDDESDVITIPFIMKTNHWAFVGEMSHISSIVLSVFFIGPSIHLIIRSKLLMKFV
ncbi:hypothetical protein HanRHA438_Chr01g0035421 [Helianthus annuus]|nr:hypothetical protein HanRHA438_Chr01g0035421 [Helianthus annuus]